MNVPFSPPDIADEDILEVVNVLKSGWLTTGPKTKEFESLIAEACNNNRAACLNSAAAALELTLRLLNVGPGDEVITTPYTYTASASAINHVGATIVLADVCKNSVYINPREIEKVITKKTKAVIAVDIAGGCPDYDSILDVLNLKSSYFVPRNDLQKYVGRIVLIADAAHSFGGIYKNKPTGNVADFSCFSFHAVKNLVTGEGGAITWRSFGNDLDDEIYKRIALLSLQGQNKDALAKTQLGSWRYDILFPGYKCNMTDILAALGVSQLRRYKDIGDKRKVAARLYTTRLRALFGDKIKVHSHFTNIYESIPHLLMTNIVGIDEVKRDEVIAKLARDYSIATNVHYIPLPMHTAYKNLGFNINDYPNTYEFYKNEISLPMFNNISHEQIDYVTQSLYNVLI